MNNNPETLGMVRVEVGKALAAIKERRANARKVIEDINEANRFLARPSRKVSQKDFFSTDGFRSEWSEEEIFNKAYEEVNLLGG